MMRVRNETTYDTRKLRSVILAVYREEARKRGELRAWPGVRIAIGYSKQGNQPYSGHAHLGGYLAHLSVPRDQIWVTSFAALWRHELWHLYGIRHADYPPTVKWCHPEPMNYIAREVGFTRIAPTAKIAARPDPIKATAQKRAAAEARAKRWATKLKRAQTGLKAAERDVARLQRKIDKSRQAT
jgi:hypothetical protein